MFAEPLGKLVHVKHVRRESLGSDPNLEVRMLFVGLEERQADSEENREALKRSRSTWGIEDGIAMYVLDANNR